MIGLNIGPEGRVSSTASGNQFGSKITTLADGGYVVVWSGNGAGDDSGVFAQRFDASGHKIGGETLVDTAVTTGVQNYADVAALDGGGYVVVWSGNVPGDSNGVYYQMYDASGVAGASGLVDVTAGPSQRSPAVTGLVGGGFAITWESQNQAGATSDYDVYMQVFTAGGTATGGSDMLVNTTTASVQYGSDVTTLADGTYIVTWSSYAQDGNSTGIYARHYSAAGAALGGEFLVNTTTTGFQESSQVTALPDGGYVIAWTGAVGDGTTYGHSMQRFDAGDVRVGGQTDILAEQVYNYSPAITALSDGGLVVCWTDVTSSAIEIMLQRYDDAGNALGPQMRVNTYTLYDQAGPQVAALADGGFVVTWNSNNEDGSLYGIYQKVFSNAASDVGNQLIYGTSGGDDLDGGVGADAMYGGIGDDTYHVNSTGDVVGEHPGEGADTVVSTVSYTLGSDVESLVLAGYSTIGGTGNGLDNQLAGNTAGNALNGMTGDDTIHGNGGNDTIHGGAGYDSLYGDDGNDTIYGEEDDDDIDGGAGNDAIDGGTGWDVVHGGDGDDAVHGGADGDTLSGDDGNDSLFGDDGDDTMRGGDGNDTLDGGVGNDYAYGEGGDDTFILGAGIDHLNGGGGEDTLYAGLWSEAVSIDLGAGRVYNLSGATTMKAYLSSIEDASGTAYNDTITGTSGDNLIDGGGGADTLSGGAGDDTYGVDNAGDVVIEGASGGTDVVYSLVSFTLGANVENLVLTFGNINGTGNSLANRIEGDVSNNLIDGQGGADTMVGDDGDDTYVVDNAGDKVVEFTAEGTDTVQSSITYTLTNNVENLVLTGSANINGTGNGVNNTLTGNSGNNVLDGAAGADTMTGGLGNDTYYVGNSFDTVNEAAGGGTDTVFSTVSFNLGSQEIEVLTLTGTGNINATGNAIANTITGNSGKNVLDGGQGADSLTGGLGADTFTFKAGSGTDTITDFTAAQNDSINVNAYTHGTANASIITQVGSDVQINLGGGNVVTVVGATVANVTAHMVW